MSDSERTSGVGRVLRVLISVVVCVLLIAGAAGTSYLIFASEPTAKSEGATRRSAALVETIKVERGDYRPRLEVLGVVEPSRDILLSPRVSGEVISLDRTFMPGGLVEAGQELLRIDPADFKTFLTVAKSDLKQVEAELAIEQGRQLVAQREFELLGEEIDAENRSLVLREPQIESIRARLEAAKAAVEQAELDLERTTIVAPFDAQILSRLVNLGSQVAPGDTLARLVGVDEYWVMASVPLRDLRWLRFSDEDEAGSAVRVRHATAWEEGVYREGFVTRLIGAVDSETRLARVLITVPDPLGRGGEGPPLILGTIVQLQIEGQELNEVIRLDRDYLRQNNTVWVMADDKLEIREGEVLFRDAEFAYLRGGIESGDEIVTTSLATVSEGLALRRVNESETPDESAHRAAATKEAPR